MPLKNDILRTLLYFDIWSFPLKGGELFTFLPVRMKNPESLLKDLKALPDNDIIREDRGYYFVAQHVKDVVDERLKNEQYAQSMWRMARVSAHIIKCFPFVRGVVVSGELSKNVARKGSDVDFLIITEANRLWIARTLLIGFKKIFLFNQKKYFCLNSFVAESSMQAEERNIYTAVEIATLKPLYNCSLFQRYLDANRWITDFFPNWKQDFADVQHVSDRRSRVQWLSEQAFRLFDATKLDRYLMRRMASIWAERYPQFDEETRQRIFRCSPTESRAYVGNFEEKILALYEAKLRSFGVGD